MIEFQAVMDILADSIKAQPSHVLNQNRSLNYYSNFEETVKVLSDSGIFENVSAVEKFKRKLQIENAVFDANVYYQNVAEIMFWRYAIEKKLNYERDKKLSTENKRDVDVFVSRGPYKYNVEIKTPSNDFSQSEGKSQVLKVIMPGRVFSKERAEEEKAKIVEDIFTPVLSSPDNEYNEVCFGKNQDNRTLDYLKSAQSKFIYSDDNNINVLVIAVDVYEIENYFTHLTYWSSGLFTNKSFENHSIFDKVDFVLLTSLVSGHKRQDESYNSWLLSSYFNLLVYNPFSKKHLKHLKNVNMADINQEYEKVVGLFPDDTGRFSIEYIKYLQEQHNENLPMESIFMSKYLAEHFPHLWKTQES